MVRILGRGGGTAEAQLATSPGLERADSDTSSLPYSGPYRDSELPSPSRGAGLHEASQRSASGHFSAPFQPPPVHPAPLPPPPPYPYPYPYQGAVDPAAYGAVNEPPPVVPHQFDTVRDAPKKRWSCRFPFLTVLVLVACITMFIVTMGINNCPGTPHPSGQSCVLPFLGRFSFEPWNINPMLGPTAKTLLDLGAISSPNVLTLHQTWRLVTAMWLHAGLIHLGANMLGVYFLGAQIETEFGFWKMGIIYLLSGISGAILSSLFIGVNVSVGASGALFGLAGAALTELIMNWDHYSNRVSAFLSLLVLIIINLLIGLLPYIDNFAHIGGCAAGLLLGLTLLVKPQRGYVDLRSGDNVAAAAARVEAGGVVRSSRNKKWQVITRIVAGVAFLICFFTGLGVVLAGVYPNCSWCHYLSCVPTSLWTCSSNSNSTSPSAAGPVCQVLKYPNGTGALQCTDNSIHSFANLTSYDDNSLRYLCTLTCS